MQENTNQAIVLNSILMYARMGINTILSLLITRYALQALGVNDFGLFSVLGSIISFMSIFNTIMLSTCNRFLTVAIGKGDLPSIRKSFNINLTIFVGCALLLLIVGLPIGDWYVKNKVNYNGPIENALMVFYFSVIGSIISTIATPFNGLLMAKERFSVFCIVDVIMHIIRLAGVISLLFFFENKLFVYTLTQAITIALPAIIYYYYCHSKFPEIVTLELVKDKEAYIEVFSFSGWVAYGAVATVVRNQAASLLINRFFNTIMNSALGIANSINVYVTMFANSLTQPMQPQITKSYSIGNKERTDELLIMSTKFSFLIMLLIGTPFFVSSEWILKLWLGEVPPYAAAFTVLLIIDNIVMSFNSGLSIMLFADGRIALYQVVVNSLRVLSVFVAYLALRRGVEPYALFFTYILFSIIIVIATQWCLYKTIHYNNRKLIRGSYVPSIVVLLLLLPVIMVIPVSIHPLLRIILTISYLIIIEIYVGLNIKERTYLLNNVKKIFHKF